MRARSSAQCQAALQNSEFADAPVVCCLTTHETTQNLLQTVSSNLDGRSLLNLCSGNPDEVRTFAEWLSPLLGPTGAFVSGAFSGSPQFAREGKGLVMLSHPTDHPIPESVLGVVDAMGRKVECPGSLGCERALDYAIVDMYLANLVAVTNGLSMLDQEGVPPELFMELLDARLPQIPEAMRALSSRMATRNYHDVTASLSTWRSFLSGRLPYLQQHSLPTSFPEYVLPILEDPAVIGAEGEHAGQDIARIQELLRVRRPQP